MQSNWEGYLKEFHKSALICHDELENNSDNENCVGRYLSLLQHVTRTRVCYLILLS